MLSVQKSLSNKIGLGFVESIFVPETHSTNFVSSSEPPVSEIVKQAEVTPPRKIKVDLQKSKPKTPNPPKDKLHDRTCMGLSFLWKVWAHSSKLFQVASC